ncbi:NfeD family protein [Wenzhouxiangella sp. XN24]|uniref:NfeD family protein n=1 Tax=Wenzhouxiangella sp. XN24 TaxID=2713569 RepID=UPI0013ECB519|nr:NfeD family protein [Wenzhouxiangella sp. XN24]NGX16604.1 nodulation protein NfeD [Wenzhouxiangella sp. XN24]
MNTLRAFFLCIACFAALAAVAQGGSERDTQEGSRALLLELNGPIGPALSNYLVDGIDNAADEGFDLVVIEMDTPGGLDTAMRDIIKSILGSSVPVVTWVSPSGSRAASAGTYILYASHVAAMAPATNLGAATPVPVGGGGNRPSPPDDAFDPGGDSAPADEEPAAEGESAADGETAADEDGTQEKADGDAAEPAPNTGGPEAKAINDAVAYIRSLAEQRGRNADWAERAVRESVSLTAERAVEKNVVDLIAVDLAGLLTAIDGRTVTTATGDVEIRSAGATVERVGPDWRTRLLAVITSPTVAYMLLLAGIYGLIFEGYNPGAVIPGVVGAVCLLLALYALQVLPVNYAGLGLIVLGLLLMIGEVFVPSFGALGLGGIVAFVVGSIILMDTDVPGYGIPTALIGSIAAVGGSIVMAIIWMAMRARGQPIVSGRDDLIGATAVAAEEFTGRGHVRVHGELWTAETRGVVRSGQSLRVNGMHGLVLEVEPLETKEK